MDIRDRRALQQKAAHALEEAVYDPKKLVLIHTAILMGASLLVVILDYILAGHIENTGGLGGLGARAILSTIQSALQLALLISTPFWQMGLTHSVLRIARKQSAAPKDLKEGFFRFGPVLRLQLARLLLCVLIGILSMNIGTTIFAFTPFSGPLEALLSQLEGQLSANSSFVVDEATYLALVDAAIPMLAITGVLYAAFLIPLLYRFRLADYAIMDEDRPGALKALGISARLMRNNRFQLFRLDLSFWWFYLMEALSIAICYADTLLPLLGITLPISADVLFFVSYGLYIAAQLALYWWAGAQVKTTYAVAYDGLRTKYFPQQPQTPPTQHPGGN